MTSIQQAAIADLDATFFSASLPQQSSSNFSRQRTSSQENQCLQPSCFQSVDRLNLRNRDCMLNENTTHFLEYRNHPRTLSSSSISSLSSSSSFSSSETLLSPALCSLDSVPEVAPQQSNFNFSYIQNCTTFLHSPELTAAVDCNNNNNSAYINCDNISSDLRDLDPYNFLENSDSPSLNNTPHSTHTNPQMEGHCYNLLPPVQTLLYVNKGSYNDPQLFPYNYPEEEEDLNTDSISGSSYSSTEDESVQFIELNPLNHITDDRPFYDITSIYPDEYQTPSPGSDGYESTVETAHHEICFRQTLESCKQPQWDTSFDGSPCSDEGFDEPALPEDHLPDFRQLQPLSEPPVRNPGSHVSMSSFKKKERQISRDSPSTIEKERRKPGRKPGQVSNVLHLWEFMRDLLRSPHSHGIIEWVSKPEGVFRVVNSTEVARLWGEKKKNKKKMTYEKLSRSLRYSRLEGYFSELPKDKNYPKKLCFKFGPKSNNWH
ncbi:uncharacterized protein LOC131952552 isoform X2 [Physella acuta]|uniref:uncharacterized protein LOC131952552 isoform X2 n=1 Tax=Physella acuta TaxID=109671 RepID=UPI0027DC01C3|nr:uncharacterized protein LOC131952552 isoform X2 [Physella acuta]